MMLPSCVGCQGAKKEEREEDEEGGRDAVVKSIVRVMSALVAQPGRALDCHNNSLKYHC
jgi:hypothetical protein